MDQTTYSNITGEVLSDTQATRFGVVSDMTQSVLEDMLGWPLDPESWENQYVESGKSKGDTSCFSLDFNDLDPADPVIGKYRLYPFNALDTFQLIDPAITVHKVKIVNGDVTCKTLDPNSDYNLRGKNGNPRFSRYIQMRETWWGCGCEYFYPHGLMLAVDADWAFPLAEDDKGCDPNVPLPLLKVLASMIAEELDPRSDIKSESITSHSYTKFDRQSIEDKYGKILADYVGPLGTFKRPSLT